MLVQESAGAPARSILSAVNSTQPLDSTAILADSRKLVADIDATYAVPSTTCLEPDSTLVPDLKLSASLLAPASFDVNKCGSGVAKKAVLMYAYGGPGKPDDHDFLRTELWEHG